MRGRTHYYVGLEILRRTGFDDPSVSETSAGAAQTAATAAANAIDWSTVSGFGTDSGCRVQKWEDAYKEAYQSVSAQGISLPRGFTGSITHRDGSSPSYTYRASCVQLRFRLTRAKFKARIVVTNTVTSASTTLLLNPAVSDSAVFESSYPSGFGVSELHTYRILFEPYY